MSEENQSEIERLKAENAKLKAAVSAPAPAPAPAAPDERVARANAEAKDRRLKLKELSERMDALTKERDDWKARAESEHRGLRTQLEAVTGELRDVRHKEAFAKIAKAHKVSDPTRLSDLYSVTGYKVEGDKPDPAKIGELIKGALKDRPYLLDADAGDPGPVTAEQARRVQRPKLAAATVTAATATAAGPGADRGSSFAAAESAPRRDRIPGRL